MTEFKFVSYETLDDGTIARIYLNRPESRNAQNRGMLVELDEAFGQAEADDQVRVVILGGAGPMFSSGHDLGSAVSRAEYTPGPDQHPSYSVNGGTREGADALWRMSPLANVANIRTPLLILQGEEDRRCPPSDNEQLFVALREGICFAATA